MDHGMMHGGSMHGGMMQGGHMGGFGMWGIFSVLSHLLILVLIGAVVYAVVRKYQSRQDDALAILRRRFAQGEIGEDEFQKRLALLK